MHLDRRAVLTGSAALGLATAALAAGPAALPERLSPRAMQADLRLLSEAYGGLHPGLRRYLPPGGFDRRVAAAAAWAARERTPGDWYLALARLTAAVRCGHSYANPVNQSDLVAETLLGRADRLPVCTAWLDGRLVASDGLASELSRGTELLAVDGVPAGRLLAAMLPLTRADGGNDGKRVAQLELRGGDRYAAFDVFRPLLTPAARAGEVRLEVRRPGRGVETVVLPTLAEGGRGVAAKADAQYGWRFTLGEDGVGVLTMPDWSMYHTRWDWAAFLDRTVDALIAAGARGLVVDLRENEGGNDCGDVLLARLVDRPLSEPGARRLVRFRETPPALRPYLDTWDKRFHQLGVGAAGPDTDGFYALGGEEAWRVEPKGPRFAGKVAVLVGPTCSSATFQFAWRVQREGVATLVGQPTGGSRRGINGGRYFFVRLPETGFEVDLPLIGFFPAEPQPDVGVVPEVVVAPTLTDIAEERDVALERARAVVAG